VLGDFQHLLLRHWIVELIRNAARLFRGAASVQDRSKDVWAYGVNNRNETAVPA
jgi:hypothetical protein